MFFVGGDVQSIQLQLLIILGILSIALLAQARAIGTEFIRLID